jgi:hypothetical protein
LQKSRSESLSFLNTSRAPARLFIIDQPENQTVPDPIQKPRIVPPAPGGGGGGGGPKEPQVDKPNTDDLLKRMRKVDPEQAKRYRQRTGQ